jgi:hydroxymethylbilane synthase
MRKITIGSRGSDLALWQANHVKRQLEALGNEVEIQVIVTQGDAIQNLSFDKLEGKGFFTKEIEVALLNKSVDLAVHSHKDLETNPPAGLVIAAVSEREDPSELLLIRKESVEEGNVWNLKLNGIIGTSSARRKSLVRKFRPDLQIQDLRGNVPTRIQKLRDGNYDAILLAKAGVDRLKIDLTEFHVEVLAPTQFVPAPAQGVLALQIREEDTELAEILQNLNHQDVAVRIGIERLILNQMEGGCQLPLGVYCSEEHKLFVAYAPTSQHAAQHLEYSIMDSSTIVAKVVNDLKQLSVIEA